MTHLELVEAQEALTTEIIDPLTGESIDRSSPAALAEAIESASERASLLRSYQRQIKDAIADLTPKEKRTERVLFEGGALKVEHPPRSYDQRRLKEAWSMPGADQLLRVERVGVKERDYKKIRDASGEGELLKLRDAIKGAEVESYAAPTVKVER